MQSEINTATDELNAAIENLKLKTDLREFKAEVLKDNAWTNSEQIPITAHEGPKEFAFDDNDGTWWHSKYKVGGYGTDATDQGVASTENPIWIQTGFDNSETEEIESWYVKEIVYTPRSGGTNQIKSYSIQVSTSDKSKDELESSDFTTVKSGNWENKVDGQASRTIELDRYYEAKYVRLVVTEVFDDSGTNGWVAVANIVIKGADVDPDKAAMQIKDYWTFEGEDADTQLTSVYGGGTKGALYGDNIEVADTGSDVFGNALLFGDGINYMKIDNYINTGGGDTSFSMWYCYNNEYTDNHGHSETVLLQHEDNGRSILKVDNNRKYNTYLNATTVYSGASENGPLAQDEQIWEHITVTFNQADNTVCFYVNGVLSGSENQAMGSNKVTGLLNLRLGAHKNAQTYEPKAMHGYIDEFYVFEKALTEEEARIIYEEKGLELARQKAYTEYETQLVSFNTAKAELDAKIDEAKEILEEENAGGTLDAEQKAKFDALKEAVNANESKTEVTVTTLDEDATLDAINAAKTEISTKTTEVTAAKNAVEDAIDELCAIYVYEAKLPFISLTLDGKIDINFYTQLENYDELVESGAYMQFTFGNKEEEPVYLKDIEPTLADMVKDETNEKETYYVFSYGVPVKDMNTVVEAQLIVPDKEDSVEEGSVEEGSVERRGFKYDYSVKEYIAATYNKESFSDTQKALIKAMSNFGDYAVAYFDDSKTIAQVEDELSIRDELNTDAVTADSLKTYLTSKDLSVMPNISGDEDIYLGSSLLLKSDTVLRHYFNKKVDGSVEKVGNDGTTKQYYVETEGIAADDLGVSIEKTVQVEGSAETATITYSPLNYAYLVLKLEDKTENENKELKDLMRAMVLYYQAAANYLNKSTQS